MVMQVIRNVQKRDEFNYHMTSVKPLKSKNHDNIDQDSFNLNLKCDVITIFRFERFYTTCTYRPYIKVVILGQILNLKRVLKSVLVISPIVTVQNQFIDSTFDWSLSQKLRRQIFSIFPKRN